MFQNKYGVFLRAVWGVGRIVTSRGRRLAGPPHTVVLRWTFQSTPFFFHYCPGLIITCPFKQKRTVVNVRDVSFQPQNELSAAFSFRPGGDDAISLPFQVMDRFFIIFVQCWHGVFKICNKKKFVVFIFSFFYYISFSLT